MNKKSSMGLGMTGSWVLLLFLVAASGVAQDDAESKKTVFIDAQAFTNPTPTKMPTLRFPQSELNQGIEGWVGVQMMVDPEGKPYEFEVVSTTGTKAFEVEALKAAAAMRFAPATLGGHPVDAAVELPVYFITHTGNGASAEFGKGYQALGKAIDAKDQIAAEAILKKLTPRNIYESAFFGVAQFKYAARWGSEREQIVGLRRAISGTTKPQYLDKRFFTLALQQLFILEVRAQDYAAALATYETWSAQRPDSETLAKLQLIAEQVRALRSDGRSYSVQGQMRTGVWSYRIFKSKFSFTVTSGRISQIKLYCQNKYVLFRFDPTLQYTIEKGFGECSIVVYGDANTEFQLVQS